MTVDVQKNTPNQTAGKKPDVTIGASETKTAASSSTPVTGQYTAEEAVRPGIAAADKSVSPALALSKLAVNGTEVQKNLIYFMERYLKQMAGVGKLTPKDGAAIQYEFWKTILSTIRNCETKDFTPTWNILLMYFKENKRGVLREELMARFPEEWPGSREESKAFLNIITFCAETCDHTTRKEKLRFVRIDKAISVLFNESDKQKLLNFYS